MQEFTDFLRLVVRFVDRKAAGVLEAKAEGIPLAGVAEQAGGYAVGLPESIPHVALPLPFLYESTGVETFFRDNNDPEPRSRRVFAFHRPETLAEWIGDRALASGLTPSAPTLRGRLREMPENHPLITDHLWHAQAEAIRNLEVSFALDRPRSLIQMATGSGKTFTVVNFVYRLVKHAKARCALFLVDRNNLGRQTFKEFDQFVTPDDGRKFSELSNVQHLQSNALDQNTVILRPAHEHEFHPEDQPACPLRPGRVRRLLPSREPLRARPYLVGGKPGWALALLHLR